MKRSFGISLLELRPTSRMGLVGMGYRVRNLLVRLRIIVCNGGGNPNSIYSCANEEGRRFCARKSRDYVPWRLVMPVHR
jgi:hypothetical protein